MGIAQQALCCALRNSVPRALRGRLSGVFLLKGDANIQVQAVQAILDFACARGLRKKVSKECPSPFAYNQAGSRRARAFKSRYAVKNGGGMSYGRQPERETRTLLKVK